MFERRKARLGDLARIVTGGTPAAANPDHWGNELDFVTPSDQTAGMRASGHLRSLSTKGVTVFAKKVVPARSTNLTCIGSTIGKISMAMRPAVTNQQINSIVAIPSEASADFLYYLLLGWSDQLATHASGSATPIVNKTTLANFEFDVPPLPEQQAIAEVLGALDDKIAANTRLAATARELADLSFPRSSKAEVSLPLGSVVTVTKGVSYRSADLTDGPRALVTLKSISRDGGYINGGLKPFSGTYKTSQVVSPGEIIVAQTDLTQAADVVGRAVRVARSEVHDTLIASLDLAVVRPTSDLDPTYLYGLLRQPSFREYCRSNTSGTTVLHLGKGAIESFSAQIAGTEIQQRYAELAHPLLAYVDNIEAANRTLAATRDALLPKLMSGQLRVKDVKRQIEEAV